MFKELKPIPAGSNTEQIVEHLSRNGVLNGGFIAVQRTEAILTGSKEPLLRKGKSIQNIADYDPEVVIGVYNSVIDIVEDGKDTFEDGLLYGLNLVKSYLSKRGIELPFKK